MEIQISGTDIPLATGIRIRTLVDYKVLLRIIISVLYVPVKPAPHRNKGAGCQEDNPDNRLVSVF
jgi:hypothetical protein